MGRFRLFRGPTQDPPRAKNGDGVMVEDPLHGHPKYERIEDLNSGTFGLVLKALDKTQNTPVAVKLLPRGEQIHNGVEREILNHKSLTHPHVIQFKEVFLTEKYLAIAMEYADQGDLFRYVRAQGRLREDLARWIFQQLMFGLDYCHRRGVANRDIKLENILLKSGARRPLVKLSDFGYSKHEDWDSAPKSRVGTPDYMPPEMLHAREGAYDAKKGDLWSCGVVLYVMVVGQYPFSRNEDSVSGVEMQHQLVLRRVLEGKFSIPAFLSQGVADLLTRLLDPDPQTRISISEIIHHPWHRVGLPPQAENMNDVYLTTPKAASSKADDGIRSVVKTAMNLKGEKDLVSDQMIDLAMGEEEDYLNANSSKESIDDNNFNMNLS